MNVELAPSKGFDDIPVDSRGQPMLAASGESDYPAYIEWLADYLYRPSAEDDESNYSEEEAKGRLIDIEIEIADWIWTHPYDDYPPADRLPPNGARHADIFHREAMSRTLSRVPDRAVRVKLLNIFYRELSDDAHK